jgi:transcriptional regulator GlxA family with amidase domain
LAALDDVLGRDLQERRALTAEVARAWSLLLDRPAGLDVTRLAREVGWSRRTLSQRLRQDIGYPPRKLDRLFRFDRSRALMQHGNAPTLTDVTLAAGYFDHAHLVHEWRALAGCTPTEWLAEGLPPVQDTQPTPDQY